MCWYSNLSFNGIVGKMPTTLLCCSTEETNTTRVSELEQKVWTNSAKTIFYDFWIDVMRSQALYSTMKKLILMNKCREMLWNWWYAYSPARAANHHFELMHRPISHFSWSWFNFAFQTWMKWLKIYIYTYIYFPIMSAIVVFIDVQPVHIS